MTAFNLTINGLPQIMQQTGFLGLGDVSTQLPGYHAGQVGAFNAVIKNVLPVAGAVFQTAQYLNYFRTQSLDSNLNGRLFSSAKNGGFHFFFGFSYHFFNTGRMDTTIDDQTG